MSSATGTYRWVATYGGDANNTTVSSGCQDEPVTTTHATPTIATTASAGGPVGTSVSDTATVSGGLKPTGTVTFELFAPGDTTCVGTPVFVSTNALSGGSAGSDSFTPTAPGTYFWVAAYDGDANNTTVVSGCSDEPVAITQATPTIATTPSTGGPVGIDVSDSATVSGGHDPTGTVTFDLYPPTDTTCSGTPAFSVTSPLNLGSASSGTFTTNAVGTWRWVATYNGDANNAAVSSGCVDELVAIGQASPTIATDPSAGGPVGIDIFDTATVGGGFNPTGSITFTLFPPSDPACTGTPVFTSTTPLALRSVGSGAFTTNAVGTWHWIATYSGDANNASVSSACAAEPVDIGVSHSAVVTTVPSVGGVVGTAITDTATVTGGHSPTGTVTFNLFPPDDPTCAGTAVFTSTNTLSSASPPTATSGSFTTNAVGTWNWVATYDGDASNAATSTACQDEQVGTTQATPAISTLSPTQRASVPAGSAISDTATVSGGHSPTGSVTFNLFGPGDATCAGPPIFTSTNTLSGGSADSGPFSTTAAGTYRWVATYNGDTNNVSVSSGCAEEPVTVGRATPTIATTPSPGGAVGISISDSAVVGGGAGPTGTVTFDLYGPGDTTCTGTPAFTSTNPLVAGTTSSDSFTTNAVGAFHWVATYNGDANNISVSSGCNAEPVTVGQATPEIVTTPSPGGVVGTGISDSARVSGGLNPSGTVTFNLYAPSDTTCAGNPVFTSTNPLSAGSATSDTFTTHTVGTFRWVAIYSGDSNNTTVSSGCQDEPVSESQATPTIATFPSAGGPVGSEIFDDATVSGGDNPTGTITFKLFGPGDATCSGTPVFVSTVSLVTRSTGSAAFTTTAVGTFHWVATYNGDADNASVASGCTEEPVTVGRASSAVITTVPSAGGVVGTAISDLATVSGGHSPTGSVTFELFPPTDLTCAGTAVFTSTNPLSGASAVSSSFTTNAVGTWNWVATYNGDVNNTATSTKCTEEQVDTSRGHPHHRDPAVDGRCGGDGDLGHGDGERWLQPHGQRHLRALRARRHHLHRDPGVRGHQPSVRGQRGLRLLCEQRHRHLPLGRHLRR